MSIGKPIGGTFEDIGEVVNQSVVRPISDEVGKAVEAGIQSVVGGQAHTTQKQSFDTSTSLSARDRQSRLEDQKKIAQWRWRLQKLKELEEAQRRIREDEKRKQLLRQQEEEEQTKKEKKQIKQFDMFKKQKEVNPEIAAKGKAEIKRGVGG